MSVSEAAEAAAQKAQMRAAALAVRNTIPASARAALAQTLLLYGPALAQSTQARAVSLYWPIRSEPDTLPLLTLLAERGFATALPVTGARGEPLTFRQWRPGEPQSEGSMRIPEPAPHLPEVLPDLLFMPLTVFDNRGSRIGYGAGYYDLTLKKLRALKPVTAVGVAFAALEALVVPAEAHDQRLDYVLTENGLTACAE